MSVTRLVSQLGMSKFPAAPQSAPPAEQHFSPRGLSRETIYNRGLQRGFVRERRLASHSVGEGTAAARSAAGQGVAGVTRGRAGGPARERAGAVADCAVGGRGGRVARARSASCARQHAIQTRRCPRDCVPGVALGLARRSARQRVGAGTDGTVNDANVGIARVLFAHPGGGRTIGCGGLSSRTT